MNILIANQPWDTASVLINTHVLSRVRTSTFPEHWSAWREQSPRILRQVLPSASLRVCMCSVKEMHISHFHFEARLHYCDFSNVSYDGNTGLIKHCRSYSRHFSYFHHHNVPDLWQRVGRGHTINSVTNLDCFLCMCMNKWASMSFKNHRREHEAVQFTYAPQQKCTSGLIRRIPKTNICWKLTRPQAVQNAVWNV